MVQNEILIKSTLVFSQEWLNNKEALLKYMEATHLGVKGMVVSEDGQPIPGARVRVTRLDTIPDTGIKQRHVMSKTALVFAFISYNASKFTSYSLCTSILYLSYLYFIKFLVEISTRAPISWHV